MSRFNLSRFNPMRWLQPLRGFLRPPPLEDAADEPRSLLRDERGATFVEYISIVVLVAVAGMASWSLWQEAVKRDASDQYTTFGSPPPP